MGKKKGLSTTGGEPFATLRGNGSGKKLRGKLNKKNPLTQSPRKKDSAKNRKLRSCKKEEEGGDQVRGSILERLSANP